MKENRKETFSYTYSAKQRQELEEIRKKYLPPEEDKMAQIRSLDARASRRGTMAAVTTGTAGCLLLGVGMSCTMVWAGSWFIPGIVVGLIGIAGIAAAYPIFNHVTKKERERIAPQILKLTEELMR